MANLFTLLRLLPLNDRGKDTEILVLRHQVAVLERQLGGKKVRFTPADRVLLAALLHRLRPQAFWDRHLCVKPSKAIQSCEAGRIIDAVIPAAIVRKTAPARIHRQ